MHSSRALFSFSGLRRAVSCVYRAWRARQFVRRHRLELDQAAHHGGLGIGLSKQTKSGIPRGCGFEYPVLSMLFVVVLLGLIVFTS